MSWIRTPPEDGATGEVAAAYSRDRESLGYVANYTRVFANRPAVLEALRALNGAVKASMDPPRKQPATLAAGPPPRASYFSPPPRKGLRRQVHGPESRPA